MTFSSEVREDLCFNELLEAINGKKPIESVPGVSFRNDGRFIHNSQRPLEDLAKIKIPDRSKRIWKGYQYYGFTLDIVESSRGCVMSCNFCSIDKMYGKSFRRFSIECAEEAYWFLPVQVWSGQRLATSSAPNLTHGEVTSRVKLGEGRYQATTQVKV